MSKRMSAGKVLKSYQLIEAHRREYPVRALCQVLEVAPSGYYEWLKHLLSNRAREDARLLRLIRASFVASHGIYDAPRVFLDLREAGERAASTESNDSCARMAFAPCTATAHGACR